jgi:uncharacterized protein YeeX (DUF496 family)
MSSDTVVEQLVELQQRKNALQSELAGINKHISNVEQQVLDQFIEGGVQSLKTAAGQTVYIHKQIWANAKDGDYDRACDALVVAGYGELVQRRFNTNRLSALVREIGENEMPPVLKDALAVREQVSARVRGAGNTTENKEQSR